jgi:hypothetical protein
MAGVPTTAVRMCREKHLYTWDSGSWWSLDKFDYSGLWSIQCALRIAAQLMKAERIVLIGHDCTVGRGCAGEPWDAEAMKRMREATEADMFALTEDGATEIDHVRWSGTDIIIDHYRAGTVTP